MNDSHLLIAPLVGPVSVKMVVILAAYAITLYFSTHVVRYFAGTPKPNDPKRDETRQGFDIHAVIGKCENLITVTFILLGEITGLALVFGAKSIVRSQEIRRDPSYFLGGTLVNFVWGLIVAIIARVLVFGLDGS